MLVAPFGEGTFFLTEIKLTPRLLHAEERETIYTQLLNNELLEPVQLIGPEGPVGVIIPWSYWTLAQRVLKQNRDGKGPV